MIADYCGTEARRISENFNRNKDRFIEGKHYFKIEGEELKNLRLTTNKRGGQIGGRARILNLWTQRGAFHHAKMLNTDRAWEVCQRLLNLW
ncbi:ORF6N domain-containing protein [Candidatus Poribacteria bacterium]|nr:ORF6N domain-containing protein [Candidatus Poribacteria bacterium]